MKKLLKTFALAALMLAASASMQAANKPGTFTTGDKTFLLNGEPFIVKAAEVHYPRIPRPYWEHRIQMCKALGMNAVCIYIFWNIHEQREGQFDFTGNNDVAEFCRIAQKNGLYVIVRPGPYVCAEWEMGGLPWWLLKKKDIRLRERDPYFMERVKIFEEKVGEQLKPLTIQNGGPIIMIQVENEYGSYGEDKPYISEIRDCLRRIYSPTPDPSRGGEGSIYSQGQKTDGGQAQDVTTPLPPAGGAGGGAVLLFQCDWSSNFEKNGLDDLTWTMNFGTGANIDDQFRRLGELRPNAPKMCSEFWSGWFDKWGARHETRPAKDMVDGMDEMLSKGISFSLYMTHGGTSFGHWAGANSPGFAPDVTSYDYDAPINEYGQATPKFWELRKMMEKYSLSPNPSPNGKGNKVSLPAVPKAPMPIITVPKFELTEFAPFLSAITKPVNGALKTFEEMDMGWGTMMYSTRLPEITSQSVLTGEFHDFAQVFIDQKYIGKIDRVKNEKSLTIPAVKKGAELIIIVEGMGRINFGRAIKDFKGIVGNVTLTTEADDVEMVLTPKNWSNVAIPDDYETAVKALDMVKGVNDQVAAGKVKGSVPALALTQGYEGSKKLADIMKPGYHRGYFNLKKVGDTFLNFETWGKGQVYVNGHAMGRIWSIGPQQTLYIPGCWLKKGKNEIIVLDIVGPRETVVWGQAEPELNKLQLEKSNKHNNIGDKPDLNSATPVANGQFKAGNGWQTINFGKTAKGRYLAIECLSTQKDGDRVAIAELYLQGADGKRLSREPWKTKYANSEDEAGNHLGDKVFDLQESTYWQTEKGASTPHLLVIDLGSEQTIKALEYLPRAEQGAPGSVKDFKIYLY